MNALVAPPGGTLALDLGGTIGWAYGPDYVATPMVTGQKDLPIIGGRGPKACAGENLLITLFEQYAPVKLVMASPLPPMAQTNTVSAYQQYGLGWAVHAEAYRCSCAVSEIDEGTARYEILGQRRFSKDTVKDEVIAACRRRGIKVAGHHAGDATILWLWHRGRVKQGALI